MLGTLLCISLSLFLDRTAIPHELRGNFSCEPNAFRFFSSVGWTLKWCYFICFLVYSFCTGLLQNSLLVLADEAKNTNFMDRTTFRNSSWFNGFSESIQDNGACYLAFETDVIMGNRPCLDEEIGKIAVLICWITVCGTCSYSFGKQCENLQKLSRTSSEHSLKLGSL